MNYRKPTIKEKEKLEKSRETMIQGIEGEKDTLSKLAPTMAKSARDDMRTARAMRESVPMSAREGEAYDYAGYKKGGSVKKPTMKFETYTKTGKPNGMKTMTMASGGKTAQLAKANGCAVRGKTKGKMV